MAKLESFFLGIIAALGALAIELVVFIIFSFFSGSAFNLSFSQLFILPQFIILGAYIEEALKFVVIARRVDMLSMGRSYLTNSFFVGLGFFLTELAMVSMSGSILKISLLSEIAIIHIGTAGIIGYVVATKNPKKLGTLLFATIVATFFHASYNELTLNRTIIVNYAIFALLGAILFVNIINTVKINKRLAQD